MGERTGIGWTDKTWNAWHGCTKVSPGCAHCYMFRDKMRYGQDPSVLVRSKTTFDAPLKWREPARVFTCSWSDFFHEAADAWRPEAWDIIRRTPHLTYQILTKRPERIEGRLPFGWTHGNFGHVWLGVSVENQRWADRLTTLVESNHRRNGALFASCEPLLGALDLTPWLDSLDWLIVGGESGPDGARREIKVEWLESLVRQCDEAGVPVFVKQDSGQRDSQQGRIPDHLWARKEFPR
jgi:protein gp37